MIGKLLETFFRRKLLVLLPPVLIPLLIEAVALVTAPVQYESAAGIWVGRATYLSYTDDSNRFATPAQDQSARLAELLRTQSFLTDIARRTSLAPLTSASRADELLGERIANKLTLVPRGNNLLILQFRAATPEVALEVLNALIKAYRERTAADSASQASLAISFYEGRLKESEGQYAQANEAVRRYIQSNPRLTDPERGGTGSGVVPGVPTLLLDPQLAELQRRMEIAQKEVDAARASLEKARLDVDASAEGADLSFRVVDPPRRPLSPALDLKKIVMIPAVGLLLGIGLSVALLVLLIASDRSVRSETELPPGARVLGTVPRLKLRRVPRRAGAEATRRAVGFVAGAPHPAPQATR